MKSIDPSSIRVNVNSLLLGLGGCPHAADNKHSDFFFCSLALKIWFQVFCDDPEPNNGQVLVTSAQLG